ncbi:MAG: tetratricopeptide repeat protein [Acidobacteriia bacterium]|nr:tetratricopeptide repeat protein [Terriglobia bacterium]
MKSNFRQICGRTTLLFITIICAVLVFAGTQVRTAAQNPVDLDKALQEKPVQDRAQSYYHYALAKWYDNQENLPRALSEMQLAVRFNDNDASVHVALADLLVRMNRIADATDEAQKASKLDPKDPEPHWVLATIFLRSAETGRGRQASPDAVKQAVKELEAMKEVAPTDQRAYFALGGCYMELGQPEKAIPFYERWQTLVPDSDQGYVTIAQYYERQGIQDKAIEYLRKAVETQPDSVQSMAMLAGLYAKAKREKEAIPLYRKIIELTGGSPELKRQLASTLLDAQEFTEATGLLGELAKDDPQDTSVRVMMARAQVGARQFAEAIENLKSLVASDPDNIEALFYLGAAYEQASQPAEAVKIFGKLVDQAKGGSDELKNNMAVFQQNLAASYQDMGEYQKAIAIYEEMVKSDPSPHTYFLLINAYRIDKQYDKALSLGKPQFEKNPKDDNLALVYARTLADSGKTKEGAEILDKMLQSKPSNLDIYINLSQIYVQARRFGEAEKVLRRAEEQKLDKERLKFQLATVYDKQKDYDRAESLLKEILKEDPKDGPTLNYIGYMLADRGVRLEEAVKYVQEALILEPNNPAYLDSLGWAFFKLNDLKMAEKYLLQAGDMEKKDPVIQDHIGDLYFKIGNLEKAQEFWKKSLSNGGEDEDVKKVREKLDKVQETLRKQKRSE